MTRTEGKRIFVVAGPKGAGKTTFATEFLPNEADCRVFVNADLIAAALNPFGSARVAVEAGRLGGCGCVVVALIQLCGALHSRIKPRQRRVAGTDGLRGPRASQCTVSDPASAKEPAPSSSVSLMPAAHATNSLATFQGFCAHRCVEGLAAVVRTRVQARPAVQGGLRPRPRRPPTPPSAAPPAPRRRWR